MCCSSLKHMTPIVKFCFLFLPFLRSYPKIHCLYQCLEGFPPCLLLGISSFQDLYLRPLIKLELIFVQDERQGSNAIFWHMYVQFFQHHLLKRLFSPKVCSYQIFLKISSMLINFHSTDSFLCSFYASNMLFSLLQLFRIQILWRLIFFTQDHFDYSG